MKRVFFLSILCMAGLTALNRIDFNEIMLGTPIAQVMRDYGEPYAVYRDRDGTLKYEYVERISMNRELVYENHYYLTVDQGKVIAKCFREENRPPFDQLYQVDPNYPTYP